LISIKYSGLNYASIYQYDGNLLLEDSEINYLNQFGISGVASIERNAFIDSCAVRVNNGIALIRNNLFFQQTDWAIRAESNTNASDVIAELNSFLSTDRIAVRLDDNADITALNNYWGTTNRTAIESMIHDRNDDLNVTNVIEYDPFLTEPDLNTPILDSNQPPTSNCGGDQVVYDQVTLNGTGSFDPDGSIVSYDWSLQHRTNSANVRTASGDNPTVSNLNPGFYDVCLTVTDDDGAVDVACCLLAVAGSCSTSPFPDEDEDGEPDFTDLCPNTPFDNGVDSNGCSLEQFCTVIDTSSHYGRRICNRSDWENDEPLRIKGDCAAIKEGQGPFDYRCVPR
jgi:hypothetical protein